MTNVPACQALLARLVANDKVTTSEFKAAVGDEHWQGYRIARDNVKAFRIDAENARDSLSSYLELLTIADMKFGQSEWLSGNKETRKLKRLLSGRANKIGPDGAETLRGGERYYERALERLEEIIARDRSLTQYLDRTWDREGFGGMIAPDHESMPRLHSWFTDLETVYESRYRILEEAIANPTMDSLITQPNSSATSSDISRLRTLTKWVRR